MSTMMMRSHAPSGAAAAKLVRLESGDGSIFIHAVRIKAPEVFKDDDIVVFSVFCPSSWPFDFLSGPRPRPSAILLFRSVCLSLAYTKLVCVLLFTYTKYS